MSTIRLALIGECDIFVDDRRIAPSASHLFALTMLLAMRRTTFQSRIELQRLLFGAANLGRDSAHNLRQLLYRLRRLGIVLDESGAGIRLRSAGVLPPISQIAVLTPLDRAALSYEHFCVLPGYDPELPQSYLDWLEATKATVLRDIANLLTSDLKVLRTASSWRGVLSVSETLTALGMESSEVIAARCEALALLGRRHEALDTLDTLANDAAYDHEAGELRALRSRLARRPTNTAGRLIGRSEALALLAVEWDLAGPSGGRLTLLAGAGGIGKTRTAEAFTDFVKLRRANVIWHRCDPHSRDCPLSLVANIVPQLRRMRGGIGASPEYTSLLDRVSSGALSPTAPLPDGFSLEAIRSDLQAATIDLIEAVSSEARLLLVIDDAHFLDSASCSVIRTLTSGRNSAAIHVVACMRRPSQTLPLLNAAERTQFHSLGALSAEDSRSLLLDRQGLRPLRPEEVEWCLLHSSGNPFFLHSLARHCETSGGDFRALPSDIHSLAARSYHSLDENGRLLLEVSLLLGRHATLTRVGQVSQLSQPALLSALRQLEEHDLVRIDGGIVVGPHMLLHDALRALIPSGVAAVLARRIATVLTDECGNDAFVSGAALSAAECLIGISEHEAAFALLQRYAKQAAALGEPSAAAHLLSKLIRMPLDAATRCTALEEIVLYADAAGLRGLAAECLRERMSLARQLSEPADTIQAIQLRSLEADILNGGDLQLAVMPLASILDNPDSATPRRQQAILALLIIADAEYDATLAHRLYRTLEDDTSREAVADCSDLVAEGYLTRARLVYHTTFGDSNEARRIATGLLRRFPEPSMCPESRASRRFAAFSLYRLLLTSDARLALEAEYVMLQQNSIWSEALYSASLLTEIAISDGDLSSARTCFAESTAILKGTDAHKLAPNSGYASSAAMLAMLDGQYSEAEAILARPQAESGRMRTARYEAICGALRLRLYMMRGRLLDYPVLVTRLQELYLRGCSLGGQDTIAEMLWCHAVLAGNVNEASRLLGDYLLQHRREPGRAEWLLRHTTSADDAWAQGQRRPPAEITRRKLERLITRSAGGNSHPQKSLASS